jgi:glycosyltransferase involved in cell wall biosynthesis
MVNLDEKKRIVIIGPVLPFRGGISQHTTMLARATSENSDVLIISFARLYPQWLFPGESDRDPAYIDHKEKGAEYILDSLNPVNWTKVIKRIREYKPDLVIVPWWTVFLAPCIGYICRSLTKKGIEVVLFCHNVVDHEVAYWKYFITKRVLKNASRYVVQTREDELKLKALLSNAKTAVHPHPIYDQFPEPKGSLRKRKSLELLFYGFIRPYKGLGNLIDAMTLLKGKDIQLTIAGEFWSDEEETRRKIMSLGLGGQIELRPGYHADEETAELFARSDVVVLPYSSATGSGVVPIAYHYNKPVIVTSVGGLPDVVLEHETGWIVEPDDPVELANVIDQINRNMCSSMSNKIIDFKKSLTWDSLSRAVLNYE